MLCARCGEEWLQFMYGVVRRNASTEGRCSDTEFRNNVITGNVV